MDGKIYVNSKENEGTTFTVDIPLLKKESETKIPDFENMGLNALVVDDEEEECRHAVRVLQEIKIQAEWVHRQSSVSSVIIGGTVTMTSVWLTGRCMTLMV